MRRTVLNAHHSEISGHTSLRESLSKQKKKSATAGLWIDDLSSEPRERAETGTKAYRYVYNPEESSFKHHTHYKNITPKRQKK